MIEEPRCGASVQRMGQNYHDRLGSGDSEA